MVWYALWWLFSDFYFLIHIFNKGNWNNFAVLSPHEITVFGKSGRWCQAGNPSTIWPIAWLFSRERSCHQSCIFWYCLKYRGLENLQCQSMRKLSSCAASCYITSQHVTSHHITKKGRTSVLTIELVILKFFLFENSGNEVVYLAMKIFVTKGWRSQGSSVFQQIVHFHITIQIFENFCHIPACSCIALV
jgi:hypothetical protein